MAISIVQNRGAVMPRGRAIFSATGGIPPYAYFVEPDGAGGSINSSTGYYTAPNFLQADPAKQVDTIRVVDSDGEIGYATIIVSDVLAVLVDILLKEFSWDTDRIYTQNQNMPERKDQRAYIVVSEGYSVPFGASSRASSTEEGMDYTRAVATRSVINFDIKSKSLEALHEKERILLGLCSNYSLNAQSALGFKIARLPSANGFVNLSGVDGSAIPYWYRVSINVIHAKYLVRASEYYDKFQGPTVTTNP